MPRSFARPRALDAAAWAEIEALDALHATRRPGALRAALQPGARAYAALNPGQAEGDTLLCLCPLGTRALAAAIQRAIRRRPGLRDTG